MRHPQFVLRLLEGLVEIFRRQAQRAREQADASFRGAIRITVDPNRPDNVYAALELSGVLRSTDGGDTWSDISAPLIKLAEQPHLQSNVGGRHCGHCEGMLDSHATAISVAAPDTVFLADGAVPQR